MVDEISIKPEYIANLSSKDKKSKPKLAPINLTDKNTRTLKTEKYNTFTGIGDSFSDKYGIEPDTHTSASIDVNSNLPLISKQPNRKRKMMAGTIIFIACIVILIIILVWLIYKYNSIGGSVETISKKIKEYDAMLPALIGKTNKLGSYTQSHFNAIEQAIGLRTVEHSRKSATDGSSNPTPQTSDKNNDKSQNDKSQNDNPQLEQPVVDIKSDKLDLQD